MLVYGSVVLSFSLLSSIRSIWNWTCKNFEVCLYAILVKYMLKSLFHFYFLSSNFYSLFCRGMPFVKFIPKYLMSIFWCYYKWKFISSIFWQKIIFNLVILVIVLKDFYTNNAIWKYRKSFLILCLCLFVVL